MTPRPVAPLAQQLLLTVPLLLATCFLGTAGAPLAEASEAPHFLAGTESFLRSSSRRVGLAAASVLGVQNRLDDLRKDLSGEYGSWQKRKRELAEERSLLQQELATANARLFERSSVVEEVKRLNLELERLRAAGAQARATSTAAKDRWRVEKLAMTAQLGRLETQVTQTQAEKLRRVAKASEAVSQVRSRNRKLQSEIFKLNQQAVRFGEVYANQTVFYKRKHSGMLSEVSQLQKDIHALQAEVVNKAQVQLDIQRTMRRLANQAQEVVTQKQQLVQARATCDQSLEKLDHEIMAAQREFRSASAEMVVCQRMDAEGQALQVQLNECKMTHGAGR
eukprot:TRINITY_DN39247_c0_g1_i1.p1 TRINITY_DN39247_c0_g1~~TRINITY_DN39247_c0_g1_i1.p1  ORF type:complete len:336 (-),score=111.12 TRINITY_DN39247_c0_g1_i1:39-1046(-)